MKKIFLILFLSLNLFARDWEENGKTFIDVDEIRVSTISGHSPIYMNTPNLVLPDNATIGSQSTVIEISTTGFKFPKKFQVDEIEVTGTGINSYGRGKFKNDVEVDEVNRGVILTASNGTKWLLWVDDNGSIFTTQVASSPEIPFEERVKRIRAQKEAHKKQQAEINQMLAVINSTSTTDDEKIEALANIVANSKNFSSLKVEKVSDKKGMVVGLSALITSLVALLKRRKNT